MFTNSISWNYVQNWSGQFQFVHSFLCGTTSQVTQEPLHIFHCLILASTSPKESGIKPVLRFVLLHMLASLSILALFYTFLQGYVSEHTWHKNKVRELEIRGIVHYEFVPTGQTVNQVYYFEVLKGCVKKLDGKDQNLLPTTHGSCITTMHLLTRNCL